MALLSPIFWITVFNFFSLMDMTMFLSLICFTQLLVIVYLIKAVLDLKVDLK